MSAEGFSDTWGQRVTINLAPPLPGREREWIARAFGPRGGERLTLLLNEAQLESLIVEAREALDDGLRR